MTMSLYKEKIKPLQQQIKSLKNDFKVTLKVTSRPNSKLLKIYPDLKIDLQRLPEIKVVIPQIQEKILLKETENLMIFASN